LVVLHAFGGFGGKILRKTVIGLYSVFYFGRQPLRGNIRRFYR
jgi:hypothetical protein